MNYLYEKVLNDILTKKESKEQGNHNMIPFSFPKFSNYFEGWIPGEYIGLLGLTGSGKSRLARNWLYSMVDFSMETNYPVKILYFALEDPEIPVAKKIMMHYLHKNHGITVTAKTLNSREKPISSEILNLIKKDEQFWKKFYNIVAIYNDISSPDSIDKKVQSIYEKYGDTHHIIVITDNNSNITRDVQDESEWVAIKRFSQFIVRGKWCKQNITTLSVLQSDAETEKFAFRNAGQRNLINIEPNLASIGDAKVVAKTMHYVFALFDPSRFEIEQYPFSDCYDIKVLRGKFRSLIQLKSNEGEIGPRLGLLFDGLRENFTELPHWDEKEKMQTIYNQVVQEKLEQLQRRTLFS